MQNKNKQLVKIYREKQLVNYSHKVVWVTDRTQVKNQAKDNNSLTDNTMQKLPKNATL